MTPERVRRAKRRAKQLKSRSMEALAALPNGGVPYNLSTVRKSEWIPKWIIDQKITALEIDQETSIPVITIHIENGAAIRMLLRDDRSFWCGTPVDVGL